MSAHKQFTFSIRSPC